MEVSQHLLGYTWLLSFFGTSGYAQSEVDWFDVQSIQVLYGKNLRALDRLVTEFRRAFLLYT